MTVLSLLLQDFALDPEESRMRVAAHHMVRFMTAGMALITCREPLLISINTNLKTAFLSALRVSVVTVPCTGVYCAVVWFPVWGLASVYLSNAMPVFMYRMLCQCHSVHQFCREILSSHTPVVSLTMARN